MLAGTNLLAESTDAANGALLERTLGRTGLKLPIISMGVMNADVPGILRRSYELGIRHFYIAAVDSADHAKAEGPIEALHTLNEEGKTRFIGMSTHNTAEVLNAVVPLNVFDVALVTLNYTMAHDAEMLATIEKAAKRNIGIVAMKTQAGGKVRPRCQAPQRTAARKPNCITEVGPEPRFHHDRHPRFQHL
jgi:Aldo/keto reductase family